MSLDLRWALNPVTGVLRRDRRGEAERRPWEDEGRGRATWPQPRAAWGPRSWRRQEGPSRRISGDARPCRRLDLGLRRADRQRASEVPLSKPPSRGVSLEQPQAPRYKDQPQALCLPPLGPLPFLRTEDREKGAGRGNRGHARGHGMPHAYSRLSFRPRLP